MEAARVTRSWQLPLHCAVQRTWAHVAADAGVIIIMLPIKP
jgi:hypothetical protein